MHQDANCAYKRGFQEKKLLVVDASDVGAGSVLLQEDDSGVDHPVCYYSKRFNKNQRNCSYNV